MLAGCGSGGNQNAVTPVLADNRGTYQLVYSKVYQAAPGGGVTSFQSYSTGTLRLFDNSTYTRTMQQGSGQSITQGFYLLAGSTSSILGSRHGSFTLTPSDSPQLNGTYDVASDFTLTLTYALPDATPTRSDVWVKESDSPRF